MNRRHESKVVRDSVGTCYGQARKYVDSSGLAQGGGRYRGESRLFFFFLDRIGWRRVLS